MRADRAYLAGLGTTGVLVASALLLLAVVSTLVAFRGWPGTDVADDIGNLIVGESERRLAVPEGPTRIASDAAPAAGAVAETPAPGSAAAAGLAPPARPASAPSPVRRQSTVRPQPTEFRTDGGLQQRTDARRELSDQNQSPVSLLPQTPVSAEVERVTTGLGNTTQGLTDGLGTTVGTISPPLGDTLTDTGRLLAELLRALGQPRR